MTMLDPDRGPPGQPFSQTCAPLTSPSDRIPLKQRVMPGGVIFLAVSSSCLRRDATYLPPGQTDHLLVGPALVVIGGIHDFGGASVLTRRILVGVSVSFKPAIDWDPTSSPVLLPAPSTIVAPMVNVAERIAVNGPTTY